MMGLKTWRNSGHPGGGRPRQYQTRLGVLQRYGPRRWTPASR